MTPQDMSSTARARRRLQSPPSFTVFTLLFWIAVGIAVATPLLGVLLYALGLLEFRR